MADPSFVDFDTTILAGGVEIPVRIEASALLAIWGADVGPQTAQSIFDENRLMFDEIVAEKLLVGDVREGIVVVREDDLDM